LCRGRFGDIDGKMENFKNKKEKDKCKNAKYKTQFSLSSLNQNSEKIRLKNGHFMQKNDIFLQFLQKCR
jgi:hypothetical protein